MNKAKTFEKKLIHIDTSRIEASIKDYQKPLDMVSDLFPEVEKVIERELTDDERVDIAHNKAIVLLNIFRPQFPFPNADDDFNLKALGISINPLLEKLRNLPNIYCHTACENKRLIIGEATLNEIEKANTQYTQNENQNKAFELANTLVAHLEEAESMGLIDSYGKYKIELVTKLLHVPIGSGGKMMPNRHVIKDIQ